MPTRRIEQPVRACRARMALLEWMEGYLKQQAADLASAAKTTFSSKFTVTVQDSWGSTEYYSVEELETPLEPSIKRIRLVLVAYDGGEEYFSVAITFANNPALSLCQMRLTGETARTLVNGMWQDIKDRIRAHPVGGSVRRCKDEILIALLLLGFAFAAATGALFYLQLFSWACGTLAATLLVLAYSFCSWRLPHCIFDTVENESMLDWNKWFWRSVFTSVFLAVGVRVILKLGFNL